MFYRAGLGCRFRITDLVGAGRNHTNRLRELVGRLSQRLVLALCGAGALAREPT
jgi:hypothetical protein